MKRENANHIIAGIVSGATSTLSFHPLDTVKIRMQTNPNKFNGILYTTKFILKNEKISGFYKGVISPLTGMMIFSSVMFGVILIILIFKLLDLREYN